MNNAWLGSIQTYKTHNLSARYTGVVVQVSQRNNAIMTLTCGLGNVSFLWYSNHPFVYASENEQDAIMAGYVSDAYQQIINTCCSDWSVANRFNYYQYANLSDMVTAYRSRFASNAIAMPIFYSSSQSLVSTPEQFIQTTQLNSQFNICLLHFYFYTHLNLVYYFTQSCLFFPFFKNIWQLCLILTQVEWLFAFVIIQQTLWPNWSEPIDY